MDSKDIQNWLSLATAANAESRALAAEMWKHHKYKYELLHCFKQWLEDKYFNYAPQGFSKHPHFDVWRSNDPSFTLVLEGYPWRLKKEWIGSFVYWSIDHYQHNNKQDLNEGFYLFLTQKPVKDG